VSVCVTQGIKVSVETQYLPDQSEPQNGKWIFAYDITITNEGSEPAQLLTRHWIIKDAQHQIEEVRGEGVVGETPYLEPGQSFSYRSYCPCAPNMAPCAALTVWCGPAAKSLKPSSRPLC
jgi:ApaG protein